VVEFTLTAASPLGGYTKDFGATRLSEVPGLAAVAAAIPQGGEAQAEEALRAAWLCRLPAAGRYTTSDDGATRILRTTPDQLLLLFRRAEPDALESVENDLGSALWLTDQSDAFCALDLSGPLARPALGRICPLDLDPAAFGTDHAARTMMEHMAVTILRIGEDTFRLLSTRSSARDFCHAVEVSLGNVG